MIIAFTVMVLLMISTLAISIYGSIVPFLQYNTYTQSYNQAYYAALTATERALLIAKQQNFGFNGSGGRLHSHARGPLSDQSAIYNPNAEGIRREIQGQTDRIPHTGQGQIPTIYQTGDTNNYNPLSNNESITIRIETNNTSDPEVFYTMLNTGSIQAYTGTYISTHIRIPRYAEDIFETDKDLCTEMNETCSIDNEYNNIMVGRQRTGLYDDEPFIIMPTIDPGTGGIIGPDDTHIREAIINNNDSHPLLVFGNNFAPITTTVTGHNITGTTSEDIQSVSYTDLFGMISGGTLTYTMIQKPLNKALYFYPFLEYYVQSDTNISDTHRHIQAYGQARGQRVQIDIRKPQQRNTASIPF